MAEQASSTAIVPANPGEYNISIREFDAAGRANNFIVPVPTNVDSQQVGVMLRSAILKRTTWKDKDMPTILHAVIYADRMGLDIMAGDVYMANEGRLSTTAGAKIRHAMSSGKIKGYTIDMVEGEPITIPWRTSKEAGEYKGPNYRAKVTVHVEGFTVPMTYETTLSEWFVGINPNWRTRPMYMLRRNALSKALEEVAPMGVEPEEAPPLVEAPPQQVGGYPAATPVLNATPVQS